MYSDGTTQSSEITFITVAGVLRSFPTETDEEESETIVKCNMYIWERFILKFVLPTDTRS